MSCFDTTIEAGETRQWGDLPVSIPGPSKAWLHVELYGHGALETNPEEPVGSLQIRLREDQAIRSELYRQLKSAHEAVESAGFQKIRAASPTHRYHTLVNKRLALKDFCWPNLARLLRQYQPVPDKGDSPPLSVSV